jgi:hypothetical protein
MALVLVATPGSASANTYATLAEADAYHEARLHTEDWDEATDEDKDKALVMATRLLDSMYDWAEFPATTTQALQWPRSGILAANKLENVPSTEIPLELKHATAELARQFLAEDRSLDSDVESQGLLGLDAGSVSLRFKDNVPAPKVIPDAVYFLIPSWWGTVRSRQSASGVVGAF